MGSNRAFKYLINNGYIFFITVMLLNMLFFKMIGIYEESIYAIINLNEFLTVHTALEFLSILIAFNIFIITYYTYRKNHRMRLLVYSSTFFIAGFIDFFHTMSYNGMPTFLTASSVAKATNYWMTSRIIMAAGLLIAGFIPYDKTSKMKRQYFLVGSIFVVVLALYIGTYHLESMPPMFIEGYGLTRLKIYSEYVVMILFGATALFYIRDYHLTGDRIFLFFAIGLGFGIYTEAAFTLYRSVYDTYNLLGHIYKIISSYLIFRAVFIYNLDNPYIQLNQAKEQIKLYAENLEQVVERRTSEIQSVNQKMVEDLEYARRIQQSLLPSNSLNIYGVKFISEYIPCERLSGDFYNIHVLNEEQIGMYIADVSGHGVSAAMMTVFSDRIMKASDTQRTSRNISPDKKLAHFYKEFNKSDFPNEMHIVIFEAIYNVKTKILHYCSGGMNVLPILIRKSGTYETLDKSIGFPICKFGDFYLPKYESAHVILESGDRIIFYTDGLVEYFKDNTLLEKEKLIDIFMDNRNERIETINKLLLKEIKKSASKIICEDDITYFIMEA